MRGLQLQDETCGCSSIAARSKRYPSGVLTGSCISAPGKARILLALAQWKSPWLLPRTMFAGVQGKTNVCVQGNEQMGKPRSHMAQGASKGLQLSLWFLSRKSKSATSIQRVALRGANMGKSSIPSLLGVKNPHKPTLAGSLAPWVPEPLSWHTAF